MSQSTLPFAEEKVALMLRLREAGVTSPEFLNMVEGVPHEHFVPVRYFDQAWRSQRLPIACGQSMLQPDLTARLVAELNISAHHTVLEIGTGSGYQTALLARCAKKVFSVDRYNTLVEEAGDRLDRIGNKCHLDQGRRS